MKYQLIETPTGPFAVIERPAADPAGTSDPEVETCWVSGPGDRRLAGASRDASVRPGLVASLERYFAGEDVDFTDVRLTMRAEPGSDEDFFARCRRSCRAIPRGQTRTYADLAEMAGGPRSAARAAGQAMRPLTCATRWSRWSTVSVFTIRSFRHSTSFRAWPARVGSLPVRQSTKRGWPPASEHSSTLASLKPWSRV